MASKNWVYRQYDHMVRDGSVVCPGSDAAVIRLKADSLPPGKADGAVVREIPRADRGLQRGLRLSGPVRRSENRRRGGGAQPGVRRRDVPLGATDNLNFANPHNPESFWQLQESVRGLAEACRALDAPITGGNCSLYNQSPNGPIDPTPTVALVGLIEKPEHITTQWFKDEGDAIILLGEPMDLAGPPARHGRFGMAAMPPRLENRHAAPMRFGRRAPPAHHLARPHLLRG
jgi:phosphoribosylformylglycinamidine (FGAM) synthase-like enzyme